MDLATGKWFQYLNEEVRLTEGIRDIGLPEVVIDHIESGLPKASEKAKTWMGHQWKKITIDHFPAPEPFVFRVVNHLIDSYGQDPGLPRGVAFNRQGVPLGASEEEKERWEKIKFVIQNIKDVINKQPFGKWNKAFNKAIRALSKLGMDSEKVESTQEFLNKTIEIAYERFHRGYEQVFVLLNQDPTNFEYVKGTDIEGALKEAQEYLINLEDPEQIIHTFDDGSYWYNLNTSNCPVEAERMGHCGADDRGTLVSLRKKESRKKQSKSYITMTYNQTENAIYQIKGISNDAPPSEIWEHISWFIQNMDISSVHETGEHSNDSDGFIEMNSWLASENPGVSFEGDIESRMEEMQAELNDTMEQFSDMENCTVYAEAEEYDGNIEISMSANCTFEVDLGWKGMKITAQGGSPRGDYQALLEYPEGKPSEEGEVDKRFALIPVDSYSTESTNFQEIIGLDDIMGDLPDEGHNEIEYEVTMLEGLDTIASAHLKVTLNLSQQGPSPDDFDYFAGEVRSNFEDEYNEIVEKVRALLAENQYSERNAWDKQRTHMKDMGEPLENFMMHSSDTDIQFWFRKGRETDVEISSDIQIPADVLIYSIADRSGVLVHGSINNLIGYIFGSTWNPMRSGAASKQIETPELNTEMAEQLNLFYNEQRAASKDQTQLPFGDKYKAKAVSLTLAQDTRFIIIPKVKYNVQDPERLPQANINWRLIIAVNSRDNMEEMALVEDVVRYFDENPQMVVDAANAVISKHLVVPAASAAATKNKILDGFAADEAIKRIDSIYDAAAIAGDSAAEKIILIRSWIKNNWSKMDDIERFIAYTKFLSRMKERDFSAYSPEADIEMEDENNRGKPNIWNDLISRELLRRGAYAGTAKSYAGIDESIARQIEMVNNLLQEKDPLYDLRTYRLRLEVGVQKDMGGTMEETQTEIRGIDGVTTVRTVGNTKRRIQQDFATIELKFELLGNISRERYVKRILVPGLMKISGLKILRIGRMEKTTRQKPVKEEIANLKEFFPANYVPDKHSTAMPTPALSMEEVVADWVAGSVMAYDQPMDVRNMRYHVMMPVVELLPFISRMFRAPKDAFDGMYQNFINSGPDAPVFIAIGKNGRVKVTGNEDLIWFAKRSGLEELPVFFSYQTQV